MRTGSLTNLELSFTNSDIPSEDFLIMTTLEGFTNSGTESLAKVPGAYR